MWYMIIRKRQDEDVSTFAKGRKMEKLLAGDMCVILPKTASQIMEMIKNCPKTNWKEIAIVITEKTFRNT